MDRPLSKVDYPTEQKCSPQHLLVLIQQPIMYPKLSYVLGVHSYLNKTLPFQSLHCGSFS